jgi:hypothetical protein
MRICTKARRRGIRSSSSTFFRAFLQKMVLGGPREAGQNLRVDAVGFFQPSDGAGVFAGSLRIDQRDGDVGLEQLGGDLTVQSSGGLDEDELNLEIAETGEELCDAVVVVGQREALAGGIEIAVEGGLGHVDADDDGDGRIGLRGIVLHGGFPALRMRTTAGGRVRPAVRVKYTRPPTILLRDGVLSAEARSICRRPSLRGLFATLQSPRSDLLDWTRFHGVGEHTRREGREGEKMRVLLVCLRVPSCPSWITAFVFTNVD